MLHSARYKTTMGEAMTEIHVCSLARLDSTVRTAGASHVVSLITDAADVTRPPSITANDHLVVEINDITAAIDGMVLAAPHHVKELIAFVAGWDRRRPMVIHCFAGISRSTAAAYIGLCLIQPEISEAEHADLLRKASSTATPNLHLVALADELLDRRGRMVAAIEAIGRGASAYEGTPFALATGR
jgi:predicted protein tyrosine phosphatase